MKPFFWGGIGIFLISFSLLAQEQPSPSSNPLNLTLEQSIQMALQQNLDILMAKIQLEQFQSRYREVFGTAIPNVILKGNYTRNLDPSSIFLSSTNPLTGSSETQKIEMGQDNSFSAGLSLEQSIFSGGRVSAGIRGGKMALQAIQDQVKATQEQIIFMVKQLFYSHLLAQETTQIQKDNLALANEHLDTIQARYKQGLDSDLLVLRQKVEVANAKSGFIQTENLVEFSLANLKKILSLSIDQNVSFQGTLLPPKEDIPSYESFLSQALEKNPELSYARKWVEVSEQAYKASRAEYLPDLTAFADYLWNAQSDDFSPNENQRDTSFGAGVRLNYKLFTGGEIRGKVTQAKLEVQKAKQMMAQKEQAIRLEIKESWLKIQEAQAHAKAQEAAVGQAKRALEVTELRYKQGQASQLEQNDATLASNRARTLYVQACYDFWVAWAALEKAAGISLEGHQL